MTDFEALYRRDPDPWAVRTSWYERRKRAVLMATLPREDYRYALELGCGTGEATRLLASRCAAVHVADGSPTAIARCGQAMARDGMSNVQLDVLQLPASWPLQAGDSADLIVVSELAYYFPDQDLETFFIRCLQSLAVGGDWVMCHYKAQFDDRCQATSRIHDAIDDFAGLRRIVAHDDECFRLDIWRRHQGAFA
ncbi:bifunctional 2-polyprenyl-6-hydroxyphenol methylase/3-demethylubiquinol 3-O-methyltransferase UbiG [Bordetella sp. BOR01]|uniref:class I SAM-dependent methyltransferase n=1 Tax=Bordetella sp. BOR01 TaxID=2854779 RepID=UPI001C44F150|nr:class I SAM-dependent methyltransferase [Bordetella sp. BOR01]MBV7481393.1 class I SAM-dependent methyltransferase [Bordetella sp. BOR01]